MKEEGSGERNVIGQNTGYSAIDVYLATIGPGTSETEDRRPTIPMTVL